LKERAYSPPENNNRQSPKNNQYCQVVVPGGVIAAVIPQLNYLFFIVLFFVHANRIQMHKKMVFF
jgi:hypothetical protein